MFNRSLRHHVVEDLLCAMVYLAVFTLMFLTAPSLTESRLQTNSRPQNSSTVSNGQPADSSVSTLNGSDTGDSSGILQECTTALTLPEGLMLASGHQLNRHDTAIMVTGDQPEPDAGLQTP